MCTYIVGKLASERKFRLGESEINVPLSIFRDRSLSVLEVLVEFLKNDMELSYHEIAVMLNRDDRTIWTVYNRVQKKRKK